MTVVLTHRFKLLSYSINICCFYSFIFCNWDTVI